MDFQEYQEKANLTDQFPGPKHRDDHPASDDHIVIPLLGLSGEVGTLHAEYKKWLRDGESYSGFKDGLREELGDILWYVANLSSKFDLDLGEIAQDNINKVFDRFSPQGFQKRADLPDDEFPVAQQLPRQFEIVFHPEPTDEDTAPPKVQCYWNGRKIGDPLDDNAIDDDGYRYHDAFHLAYVVFLGWSPVLRKWLVDEKRDPAIDRVRDGGRAKVYEEAIAIMVYTHAAGVGWFRNSDQEVDYSILKLIGQLTADVEELQGVTMHQWATAIKQGFAVWNELCDNEGGMVIGDLNEPRLSYRPLPTGWSPPSEAMCSSEYTEGRQ